MTVDAKYAGMEGWWLWLHAGVLAGIFGELLVVCWQLNRIRKAVEK